MTTIKEIQELATQTDDWTRSRVAESLLKDINEWQLHRAALDEAYRDLHEFLTSLVESYPQYPDDIPRSVSQFTAVLHWSVNPKCDSKNELSHDAKAHAERINEYLTFLSIWNEDREQLWEEIAQKEDN
jgi:uncharacterized protein with von Willebrand factor type A (vWA) domain